MTPQPILRCRQLVNRRFRMKLPGAATSGANDGAAPMSSLGREYVLGRTERAGR